MSQDGKPCTIVITKDHLKVQYVPALLLLALILTLQVFLGM